MKPAVLVGICASVVCSVVQAVEPSSNANDDFYARRPASVNCVIEAARKQQVPANLLLAIASIESGKNGQYVPNGNGSLDIGHFQINTIHWKAQGAFASFPTITKEDVAWRGCYNAELAAWLLRKSIETPTGQDYWTRAANYHSATPKYNAIYKSKLIPLAKRWGDWLQSQTEVTVSYKQ